MLKLFKATRSATVVTFFILLGFVSSSEALKIVEMYPSYGGYEDNSGYLYHTAYIKTDQPYYTVHWFINDVLVEVTPGGYEGDEDGPTEAYFSPNTSDYPGSLSGTNYTIKAIAWDQEDHSDDLSDTDSYDVVVYKAIFDSSVGDITDVYGGASLKKLGWEDVPRPLGLKPHKGNFGSFGASVYNYTDTRKGYAFKYDYRVVRVSAHGNFLATVYNPSIVFEQGVVGPGKAVHSAGHSDSHTSVRRNEGWRKGDIFRVEARTTVAAWNIGDLDHQDEWVIGEKMDFYVPKGW